MEKNEITTTLRVGEEKYEEFKDFAKKMNVSINSLIKMTSSIGLMVMKGEFKNIAFLDSP